MNDEHALRALLYESGELSAPEAAEFEGHASACAECRNTLSLARRSHSWGRAIEEGPAPELLAGVLARPRAAGAPWTVFRWAGATAFAAAALAGVLLLNRPEPDLSWETDLSARMQSLQQRLGESREHARSVQSDVNWN